MSEHEQIAAQGVAEAPGHVPGRPPATAIEAPLQMLPPPTIRVRHLWHRFGNRDVLRDVTFDVGAGEIFGFIGPNGAGKTTTIRVMATLLEPMAGRVEIDGIDVTLDPEAVRKLIGYMPDHAGVYDRITVREYLEFFADAFQVPSISVVDAVLELTDLGKLQDRLVAEMSKGMKQRLQLARILLHDPKVLILDEPASDLDPRARIEIRDLLLELRGLGKTIFLSSHILTELSDVCTSIGILERGKLVVAGPIHEISARLEAIRAAQAHGHAPPPAYAPRPYYQPRPQYPQPSPSGNAPANWQGQAGANPYGPPQAPAIASPQVPVGQTPGLGQTPAEMASYPPPPEPTAAVAAAEAAQMAVMATQPSAGLPPQGALAQGAPAPAQGAPLPVPAGPIPAAANVRRVKLRVLGNPEMAAYLLRGGPGIVDVRVIGGVINVGYTGTEMKIAEMVQHLVHRNIPIVGVEPERNELERIFLEVTRGDVQ